MIVGILCLICSLFATAQKPVAPRGSFSKPGLIARANLQSKNASALFAASPKAFHSASFSDEDGEKCKEECEKDESYTECMFEKCPQYRYCDEPKDRKCDACDYFTGDNKERYQSWCESGDSEDVCQSWCYDKYSKDQSINVEECKSECEETVDDKKDKCLKKCYDEIDADDLRSWQKKCANRCASEFDSPNMVSNCAEGCLSYSDCPKDSQSDYEDDCIKKGKKNCEYYKEKGEEEQYNVCVKQTEWSCEKYADVLCPKVQAWVIILIVVLVVVVAACVAVGIFLFLKFRKGGDQSKSDSQ